MCVHLWGPAKKVLYLPGHHLAPVPPCTSSSSLSFPLLQTSMLCSTTIFPMLYILDLACFFLSILFYVPEKVGIVHTWIHENVSVEKWNKIRHAYLLGFISKKVNLGKSWGAEQCMVPLVPFVLLFCACLWYVKT